MYSLWNKHTTMCMDAAIDESKRAQNICKWIFDFLANTFHKCILYEIYILKWYIAVCMDAGIDEGIEFTVVMITLQNNPPIIKTNRDTTTEEKLWLGTVPLYYIASLLARPDTGTTHVIVLHSIKGQLQSPFQGNT